MEVKEKWELCLSIIEKKVNKSTFNTWFKPIKPIKLTEHNLTIQVPSQYFYEWLENNYAGILAIAIRQAISKRINLSYCIKPNSDNFNNNKRNLINKNIKNESLNYSPTKQTKDNFKVKSNLNENLNFQSFVECENNRLALGVSIDLAKNNKVIFNPFLIYGSVGIGKTHLVHAIGNEVKKNNSKKHVIYTSAEQFTSQFVNAIKNKHADDFVAYYQKVDVLIIDDIQYLAGKDATQNTFFNIFNELYLQNKQIVLTTDRPAIELKGIMKRLIDRFNAGLSAKMELPDYQSRVNICKKKAQTYGAFDIPDEVFNYIALNVNTSVRDLEGAIISLTAKASYSSKAIDLELAKEVLKGIVKHIEENVGIDYIARFISEHYNIELEQMASGSRKKEIAIPRQVAMYFCKKYTDNTYKTIGNHFGGRDHSTVIHAIKVVSDRMDVDKAFKTTILSLKNKLNSNK